MMLKALETWNHHSPGKDMVVIHPGDHISVQDSIGRHMVKEKWAVEDDIK